MPSSTTDKPSPALRDPSTLADCRQRFPIFERLVYINSCSQGALSDVVAAGYEDYLGDWDEFGSPWDKWLERIETARGCWAGLVGARPGEVALTTSISAGVSAVATGIDLDSRPRVVTTDVEFPTIGQIWHAQEARGAEVVQVPIDDADSALERLDRVIDERTALVSLTAVSYRNGLRLPVEQIAELAKQRGALVLLDAYQAMGTYPLDVASLGVDFLTAGATKYLLGSPGLAFLWCRREVATHVTPLATGWFADVDVFEMDVSDYSPAPNARRFEAGTPSMPAVYAGVAGMRAIEDIGVAEIRAHVEALNDRLIAGIDELGATLVSPRDPARRGALVCMRAHDAQALVAALAADDVITSERDNNLRISAHCYNTQDDIDAVLESLARHPQMYRDGRR